MDSDGTDVVVNGRITLADDSVTEFSVMADGHWCQWGGSERELGARVDLLQAIADVVREYA